MDKLRTNEIREMSIPEMDDHLEQLKKKLMKINGVLESGGIPEDVGRVREIKKTIARINTEKTQREAKDKK